MEIWFLWVIRLKNHFESIQRISDTTTLPYAMHELRARILEQLDLSELRDRLMQGKGQPGMLSPQERIELWGRLKILSKPSIFFFLVICKLWLWVYDQTSTRVLWMQVRIKYSWYLHSILPIFVVSFRNAESWKINKLPLMCHNSIIVLQSNPIFKLSFNSKLISRF